MEISNETNNEATEQTKQRHGCVTAYLVLAIVANSLSSFLYLFASDIVTRSLPGCVPTSMLTLLALLGFANASFSVMLFQWKKWGFWGFTITAICVFFINLYIGLSIGQATFGIIGIGILYGILQIKKNNITAWKNLE